MNNVVEDLYKNITFCIFFENLFKKKFGSYELILQVILEIK